jgi:hypothetical protein
LKENTQQNEDFVALHEKMEKNGCDPKTMAGREAIFAAVVQKFTLGGQSPRHTYRAWVARLADPKKYGGRFSERMKRFQLNRTQKTTEAAPVVSAPAIEATAVTFELPVVVGCEVEG